jgi:predicted enzyme related to lactoylglutathione lyase
MSEAPAPTPYPAGRPCWLDLGTTDAAAGRAFYAGVLGWEIGEINTDYLDYVDFLTEGETTAGLYRRPADAPVGSERPLWVPYFAGDPDKAAAAVTTHGGTVLAEPVDHGTLGRFVLCADPGGAIFAVWRAAEFAGAQRILAQGALSRLELTTHDLETAADFYGAVLGWRRADAQGTSDATAAPEFCDAAGGTPFATFRPNPASAQWLPYFDVPDADAAAAMASELGGLITNTPSEAGPRDHRTAILTDPSGTHLAVESHS